MHTCTYKNAQPCKILQHVLFKIIWCNMLCNSMWRPVQSIKLMHAARKWKSLCNPGLYQHRVDKLIIFFDKYSLILQWQLYSLSEKYMLRYTAKISLLIKKGYGGLLSNKHLSFLPDFFLNFLTPVLCFVMPIVRFLFIW